jgi:hypothetical protein
LKALRTISPTISGSLICTLYLEIIDSSLVVYYGFPASVQVNFTKAIDDNRQLPDDSADFSVAALTGIIKHLRQHWGLF